MKDSEIQKLWDETSKRVTVSCDEAHAHSAEDGCLSGDPRDIVICKLCEIIVTERKRVRFVAEYFNK